MKKKILIAGQYLPGKLFGGPVKSLYNMVESLGNDYSFFILTGDRDLNSSVQYDNVNMGTWNNIGKGKVLYVPKGENKKYLNKIISEINFDIVYCSSFFAKTSILIQLMKFRGKIKVPVIVAPRGEFSSAALNIKALKKRVFLLIYKLFKMNKIFTYTCTSQNDREDIENVLGSSIKIVIAGNIVSTNKFLNSARAKKEGSLNIVTISRIASIKNIDYSLELLRDISKSDIKFENINFDIYGPIEDKAYYGECLEIIKDIGYKINIRFKGLIDYDEVINVLSHYHIFLFPTKGENFGHVIQEAFLAGCPAIISDQTPWRYLEDNNVGYDLSLNDEKGFIQALNKFIKMDQETYSLHSNLAFEYGMDKVKKQAALRENKKMFEEILEDKNHE